MKIAILNIYSGLVHRGAESVVYNLALNFTKHHDVLVYQGGPSSSQLYHQTTIPNINIIPTDPGNSIFSRLQHRMYQDPYNRQVTAFTQASVPFLVSQKPDVVISFNGVNQLRILKHLQKSLPFKLIFSNQSAYHPSLLRAAGLDNFIKLKAAPDVFIAISPIMYQWAQQYVPSKTKLVYIPNGVDHQTFNPHVKPSHVDLQPPIILCVAGLQSYKRIDLAIRAVAQLPSASLLVLGQGPLHTQLNDVGIKLLGPQRFQIVSVPHDQIPGYYAAADLFTLPSDSLEAFGVAYLEAMATNLPIVAPDDQLRRDIIGHAGLFTNVQDSYLYSQALQTALDSDWGNKPHQQSLVFSWPKIVEQYESLFINAQ